MRPLRLELEGFTAFRDKQEVDFSDLELFAIAGPTGAGKSSLLDAVTYALYGQVERVGNECAQLISHGLPAMRVNLEFAVGRERWRVSRRTPRSGATKVVLERLVDGEWAPQAGQVREVNARIESLVGLDYRAFTRAVLLPQGKFDQFLAGEAKDRRRILSELLGLELYERMTKKAREIEAGARSEARAKQELLEREYADVTEDSLAAERRQAKELRAREAALAAARAKVSDVVRRRDEARSAARAIGDAADEAAQHAESAARSAKVLASLAAELEKAELALARAAKAAEVAAKAANDRREQWGRVRDLAQAKGKAERLAELRGELREAEEAAPGERAQVAETKKDLASAHEAEARAKDVLDRAEAALEEGRHDHAFAIVVGDAKKGHPCPVCGRPLAAAPKVPPAPALERAVAKRAEAKRSHEAARERTREAQTALKEAERTLEQGKDAVAALRAKVAELETGLRAVLGARLPPDPGAAIAERVEELEVLEEEARLRERQATDARSARDQLAGKVEKERAALLALPFTGKQSFAARAGKLAPGVALPAFAARAPTDGPAALKDFAAELATAFASLGKALAAVASARGAGAASFLAEALAVAGDLVPRASSLDALAASLEQAVRNTDRELATAEHRAKDLAERLARKSEMSAAVKVLETRAALMHQLALELQANAIVDFLQAEALRGLAAEGTKRLAYLSADRYRLRYRDDEFFVVDAWNGNEERSVRTLSGGETFLASLALALSLSEQVRALAATEKARLESLFLDEGFGTLDPDALKTAVEAVSLLGQDGRLVGVVSHVRELTDEFPRIEVEKSQRGSRVKLALT